MSREIIDHLMEIKERMVKVETMLKGHVELSAKRDATVDQHDRDITKAKASIKTLRWVFGILLITVPATVAALARIWKP